MLPAATSPAALPLAVLTVFASAKLLREIFERLKQPGIVGEILAGILIGPHVLNWIRPSDFLSALSELGVIFLLFRIGLEVRPSGLLRAGGRAATVAFSGVTVSFVMSGGVALLWGRSVNEALFIASACVATSVVITAEVLASGGLLRTPAGRVILAAAVVDDVLGLIVFAVVTGIVSARVNWVDLALTAILAVGFTAFAAFWGHRAARRFVPKVHKRLKLAEAEFVVAMALLFGLSVLAVYAGVAAIIGAFLAGMALSETVEERVHTMSSGVAELLVPFFLVGIGLSLDPTVFRDSSTFLLAAALLLAAIASKVAGCGLAAWPMGGRDALRVGAGMVPRGEVGMVVAALGRRMGVLSESTYAIIVFLSIATTLAAPPMVRRAFRELPAQAQE